MTTLRWRAYLRASHEPAARKLLERLFDALELEFETQELEKYWKDNSLYVARGAAPFPIAAPDGAVFALLKRLGAVTRSTNVSAPSSFDGGRWSFNAFVAEGGAIPGVEMVDLELSGDGEE